MNKKIIGVSPRLQKNADNEILQVNTLYLKALTDRKLVPLILPYPEVDLTKLLEFCDGFLIIGGNDLNPKYYQEENAGLSKGIDERLDKVDQLILDHAIKNKKPVLGICRGLQSINVFMGGSLYQDIENAHLSHSHQDKEHPVKKVTDTLLTAQLPSEFMINTYHHQAINAVAPGFKVIYQHEDIIEGIEHESLPIIAFQWHPERMQESPSSKVIFDYFKQLLF